MKTFFQKKLKEIYLSKYLIWGLILFGIILRVFQYLSNRSLWTDECAIALNVMHRSFLGLFSPLDHGQFAPVFFLLFEKLCVNLFGTSEYALRLFPLLAGIIAIFVFYKFIKYFFDAKMIPFALLLFVTSNALIYFSSEIKQYSSDVLVALLLYLLFICLLSERLNCLNLILFGILGSVFIWCSHPSIFVLASISTVMCLHSLLVRKWDRFMYFILLSLIWLFGFAINFSFNLASVSVNGSLQKYWLGKSAFMPLPLSLYWFEWIYKKIIFIFEYPGGFCFSGIALFLFVIGSLSFYRRNKRVFWFLILPLFFALLASLLQKYPFTGRFLLFYLPVMYILITEGVNCFFKKSIGFSFVSVFLVILLVFHLLQVSVYHLIKPRKKSEIRFVLKYLVKNLKSNDFVYYNSISGGPLLFYSNKLGFNRDDFKRLKIDPCAGKFNKDLRDFAGKNRVWLILSNLSVKEESFFISYLDDFGQRIDQCVSPKMASLYLYSFNLTEKNKKPSFN